MKCKFLLVLLFTGILSCAGISINPPNPYHHDHLKLSLMWPNSYCWTKDVKCRSSLPQYFIVNSLWGEGGPDNPQPITDCISLVVVLDSVLAGHKYDLLKYWPDLSTYNYEDSKKMWKDQWKKYGSCIADVMPLPESYISNTLQLRETNNMYQILKSGGIVANGSSYPADKIISAVRKATRMIPDIVCETDRDGNVFLSEIHQCISNDGKTFIDCEHMAKKCDKDPIFPDQYYGNN